MLENSKTMCLMICVTKNMDMNQNDNMNIDIEYSGLIAKRVQYACVKGWRILTAWVDINTVDIVDI